MRQHCLRAREQTHRWTTVIFWMCKPCPFRVHKASGSISKSAIPQSYLIFFHARISKLLVVLENLIWSYMPSPINKSQCTVDSANWQFGLLLAKSPWLRFMDPVSTPWMSSTSNPSPVSMAKWAGPWCGTRRVWTATCSSATPGWKGSSNSWGKCCTAGREVRA